MTDSSQRERTDDMVLGHVLAALLARVHLMPPDELTAALIEEARPLGIRSIRIYLADLQQRTLRPLYGREQGAARTLAIESTLAGRAFQTVTIHHAGVDVPGTGAAGQPNRPYRLWVPLVDGTERLGVLEFLVDEITDLTLSRCRTLASLTGLMIISKGHYSDTYVSVRRTRPLTLAAEMIRAFMGSATFATPRFVISATLEPAYEVGGDAFDYALLGEHLHVSLLDATGHDLAAGLVSSVGIASCRNTRRAGGSLTDLVVRADEAIAQQFGGARFATGLLCELDVTTGRLAWVPCGHPPPLLIRENKVVKELAREPCLPLGITDLDPAAVPRARPIVYAEQLQPGDRVLLYTDGVVEGRSPVGEPFGRQRLSDLVIRNSAAGMSAPETLRRLNRAIVDFQDDHLSDDATTVLLEWMPEDISGRLTA